MRSLLNLAAALLTAKHACALEETHTEEDEIKYFEFARLMRMWGYTWEPYTLTTEDDYILTTFRITGNKNKEVTPDPELNPIVIMAGLGGDATSWIWKTAD